MSVNVRIFIQARMSSSRFPGKMLAPLLGRPVLAHVVEKAAAAVGLDRVVVLTSTETSDDALVCYTESFLKAKVYRGDLSNVVRRFQKGIAEHPCEWFVRICGDSPLIDPRLILAMIKRIRPQDDLVTNVAVRTFPPGQSVEILKASTFNAIEAARLKAEEQEHVTLHYYSNPVRYVINQIRSVRPELVEQRMVVDTLDDLFEIEAKLSDKSAIPQDFASLMEFA